MFISSEVDFPIISLGNKGEETVIATKDRIYIYDRARLSNSFALDEREQGKLISLEIMGDSLAILREYGLEAWEFKSCAELRQQISFSRGSSASCCAHPMTYLNKMVIGFKDGHMELWNIHSGKLIFSFESFPQPISCLVAAPVVDIIAVGLQDGTVCLMDIRQNKQLFSLQHQSAVSGISFRTDIGGGSQMVVAQVNGMVALWDLNKQRLMTSWTAHEGFPVATLEFVQNQPIVITTAGDNSIKEWIIEGDDSRLLRSRSGHAEAPRRIRFYGEEDEAILSAGRDKSFRMTSMIKDSQSAEFSQGSLQSISRRAQIKIDELKLDPIVAFDMFSTKDSKWDNVVTAHEKSFIARTWRADHKKIGSHELKATDKSFVTAVGMSSCGNFALLGTAKGSVDVFNVQSGLHRKHFKGPESRIVGLGIDTVNQHIICAHCDGTIRTLGMINGQTRMCVQVGKDVTATTFHSDSELLATALDNNEVNVFDVTGSQLVRRLIGHRDAIVDMQFSRDGRWLVSASADKTVRTWDLATGLQIDCLEVPETPVSLAFSTNMDFLAVVLEDDVAIHLYTNVNMYRPVAFENVKNYSALPTELGEDPMAGLVELSLEPRSKWSTLYNLETIKARNKPVLPPKSGAEKAPFFLDALLSSRDRKRDIESVQKPEQSEPNELAPVDRSELFTLLNGGIDSSQDIFAELKKLGPSAADFEIRSLSAHSVDELSPLLRLLEVIVSHLDSHRDYELAITYLNLILKAHSDLIEQYPTKFSKVLHDARQVNRNNWDGLQTRFQDALLLISFSREH